ncbi:hypothetical protein [Streptomyces xiamenensis]|uniref:hypothetical protein n=1 Tax=Streptomyces xiamenensis TaxID=408015 RepID=UPI0037D08956
MSEKSAAQRVAQIRSEAAARGEDLDHLTDIEVLNSSIDRREAEWIATRDRYMSLLVSQRHHEEQVRSGVSATTRERIDGVVADAIRRVRSQMADVLRAVERMPDTAQDRDIRRVKGVADIARTTLARFDESPSGQAWRPDNNAELVHAARGVVGVLAGREGIPASEVIRLVRQALDPNGNLRDLFKVADTGAAPGAAQPVFVGDEWADRGSYYAYEPDVDGSRIVAYALGEQWHLDVYSPAGALLAYGVTTADRVAELAPALIAHTPTWTQQQAPAWSRFTAVADGTAPTPIHIAPEAPMHTQLELFPLTDLARHAPQPLAAAPAPVDEHDNRPAMVDGQLELPTEADNVATEAAA